MIFFQGSRVFREPWKNRRKKKKEKKRSFACTVADLVISAPLGSISDSLHVVVRRPDTGSGNKKRVSGVRETG